MVWVLFIIAAPSEEPQGFKVTCLCTGSHVWPWAASLCYVAGRQKLPQASEILAEQHQGLVAEEW